MINTLNESALHKALKTFYAVQYSAAEEVKVERWYCDLVCPDNTVIEIQNKNVGAIKEKIAGLLKTGRRVILVHPIIGQKTIQSYNKQGQLVQSRKSPKKESVYSALREFTGIAALLLDKNFFLLLPKIAMAEKRLLCEEPVQSANGRRRFKKAWQKTDKALLTIGETVKFSKKDDWLCLLPSQLFDSKKKAKKSAESFSAATIKEMFAKEKKLEAARFSNLLLWLLREMGLIVRVPHSGRGYWYVFS